MWMLSSAQRADSHRPCRSRAGKTITERGACKQPLTNRMKSDGMRRPGGGPSFRAVCERWDIRCSFPLRLLSGAADFHHSLWSLGNWKTGTDGDLAGGPPSPPCFFLPVSELWVPRPCDFCKGGYDAADSMRLSCLPACIVRTVRITCTLSPTLVTTGCPSSMRRARPTASWPFSNKRGRSTASWLSVMS